MLDWKGRLKDRFMADMLGIEERLVVACEIVGGEFRGRLGKARTTVF